MAKQKKEQTVMQASRKDDMVMPNTNNQGWGQVTNERTQFSIVENPDGSRTILHTGINE